MTSARDLIARALTGRRLLDHPFYRRWEAGALEPHELATYAAQYRHFEAAQPGFLASIASTLPPGFVRDAVTANLCDEVGPPAHITLFDAFATSVGAEPSEPSAAMHSLLHAYVATSSEGAARGLAGLLAYEIQGAEIAASKGAGLRAHYGADDAACTFWDVHATVESEHADWALEALEELTWDSVGVEAAASTVARAWWEFLDERELVSSAPAR